MQVGTVARPMGEVAIPVWKAPVRMGTVASLGCDALLCKCCVRIPVCGVPIRIVVFPFGIVVLPIWMVMIPWSGKVSVAPWAACAIRGRKLSSAAASLPNGGTAVAA